ncbi:MAG: GGDEF domain-containing protein [Terracidiphilus sp.]
MDYDTFFITNIVIVTVFAGSISLLAYHNRHVVGMRWFALAQVVGLAKLVLQALEGKIPAFLGSLMVSELYLVSIMMQWLGLRWFVVRKPARSRWAWIALGIVLAAYTGAFAVRIPYIANVINVPFVAVCGISAWMLWKYAQGPYTAVSRVTSGVAALQMAVAAFRAVLTNLRYIHPRLTVNAHTDPSWVYSLTAAAFLAACMAMCEMWFLVTELQRELEEQACTDPLTGAMNRRAMQETALRETARSARQGHALSMIVVDIDNFKHLNDTRGHAAGDRALQMLVCRMRSMLRQQDSLARTGGEEFAILLPDTAEPAALKIAERLRQAVEDLEEPFETGPIRMTVCAGVAQLDASGDWEAMMRRADQAMYGAKERGRNRVAANTLQPADSAKPQAQPSLKGCGCTELA